MLEFLSQPWPWYVAGPLVGLMVPLLFIIGNKYFGMSSSLMHVCAATLPGDTPYLKYDWKSRGGWNLIFAVGVIGGGLLAGTVLRDPEPVALTPAALESMASLGVDADGFMVPAALFSSASLTRWRPLTILIAGGFLVGFGARWAGGCTSGHAISGLATLQLASLIAVVGFFAGGLLSANYLLPLLLGR
jgi:uncharacterized membrane protein YedE/YeeE